LGFNRCTLRRLQISFLLLFALSLQLSPGQNNKAKQAAPNQSTFRVPVNVVLVVATVTDKAGNPVTDLTAKDFRVYDDGKPQTIQTFAMELFGPDGLEDSQLQAPELKQPSKKQNVSRPRLTSIVIDDLTMYTPLRFAEIVKAVKEFIKNDTGPTDQIAILSGSRTVQFLFSNNKEHLLEEAESVLEKLSPNWNFRYGFSDREAWGIANYEPQYMNVGPAELITAKRQNGEAEYRTYKLMYTIRQHVRALSHFEGTKSVLLFSDGFLSQPGTAAAYQLQELINLALHSGIVLNTLSTRGVNVDSDNLFKSPDAAYGKELDPGQGPEVTGAGKLELIEADRTAQEAALSQLASDTGGQFFNAANNMYKGLRNAANHESYLYIMSYSMPQHAADGSYHKINLEVTRPGLRVSHRKGYYTAKEELTFESRRKEDIMAALSGPGNMKEIPMTLSYNYSQEADSNYAVSFITNVDIRGLRFLEEDQRRKNQLSLVLVAFDENDQYVSGLEKAIDFRLLETSYASLRQRGLRSRVELKLPMGRYKIKAVVREDMQGKLGSIAKSVEIP
jgi:VWFA-related protein